jgi:hypothetical protein
MVLLLRTNQGGSPEAILQGSNIRKMRDLSGTTFLGRLIDHLIKPEAVSKDENDWIFSLCDLCVFSVVLCDTAL